MNEQNRQLLGKGRRKWHSWATTLADTHHKCFRVCNHPIPMATLRRCFVPILWVNRLRPRRLKHLLLPASLGSGRTNIRTQEVWAPEAEFARTTLSCAGVANGEGAAPRNWRRGPRFRPSETGQPTTRRVRARALGKGRLTLRCWLHRSSLGDLGQATQAS